MIPLPTNIVYRKSVCPVETAHWRSIAVGDDIPPAPTNCGTEGFRPSSSSDS